MQGTRKGKVRGTKNEVRNIKTNRTSYLVLRTFNRLLQPYKYFCVAHPGCIGNNKGIAFEFFYGKTINDSPGFFIQNVKRSFAIPVQKGF